jgi:hypothetical protein
LGIYLNTIGVGLENHNDVFLEQLADNGDGLCNYVGDALEARRALVENFTGAFEPVARDVKLQVTFDPARVGKYRLLGYENRAIADRDFTNAKVDAAELNAGHEVVALYELQGVQFDGEAPLGTFKLRYKAPFGDEQHMDELERDAETELGLSLSGSLSQFDWRSASLGYQRGALAAQVAEVLRRSGHAKGDDFDGLVADIKRVADASTDADFREFAGLIERNQARAGARAQRRGRARRGEDRRQGSRGRSPRAEAPRPGPGRPGPDRGDPRVPGRPALDPGRPRGDRLRRRLRRGLSLRLPATGGPRFLHWRRGSLRIQSIAKQPAPPPSRRSTSSGRCSRTARWFT